MKRAFYTEIQNLYNIVSIISYASIIIVLTLSSPIASTVFGSDYADSVTVLRTLAWAVVFVNLGILQQSFLSL